VGISAFRQPCLCHYSPAFAFSAFLYPQYPQPSLRSALPALSGDTSGLPRSACSTTVSLGSLYSPGALLVHDRLHQTLCLLHRPFGSSLLLCLRLVGFTTFIECSHMLALLPNPGPIPAALSERWFSHGFHPRFLAVRLCPGSYHKRPLLVSHVPVGYCRWNGRSCPWLRQDN